MKQPAPISTISVLKGTNPPVIVAGDTQGQLIFLTMEGNNALQCAMGGHNDRQNAVMKVICVNVGAKFAPVSIDP